MTAQARVIFDPQYIVHDIVNDKPEFQKGFSE